MSGEVRRRYPTQEMLKNMYPQLFQTSAQEKVDRLLTSEEVVAAIRYREIQRQHRHADVILLEDQIPEMMQRCPVTGIRWTYIPDHFMEGEFRVGNEVYREPSELLAEFGFEVGSWVCYQTAEVSLSQAGMADFYVAVAEVGIPDGWNMVEKGGTAVGEFQLYRGEEVFMEAFLDIRSPLGKRIVSSFASVPKGDVMQMMYEFDAAGGLESVTFS